MSCVSALVSSRRGERVGGTHKDGNLDGDCAEASGCDAGTDELLFTSEGGLSSIGAITIAVNRSTSTILLPPVSKPCSVQAIRSSRVERLVRSWTSDPAVWGPTGGAVTATSWVNALREGASASAPGLSMGVNRSKSAFLLPPVGKPCSAHAFRRSRAERLDRSCPSTPAARVLAGGTTAMAAPMHDSSIVGFSTSAGWAVPGRAVLTATSIGCALGSTRAGS
mmetsp:Transcript_143323/g.363739  ORF Transcript_143323/g.363739 Transcript_143323/m.363739 type:complete len:223 (-) Transcript_143323:398-1066(-)